MARETDFAQATGERTMQAASEFAEESFKQGKLALDRFLSVTRKMAEDWEHHAFSIREHATVLTEKTLSNTMDFGEKVSRAKDPQEFAKCQSEYLARQAQTLADGTKEFSEKMQQASRSFASRAMHQARWRKRLAGWKRRRLTSAHAQNRTCAGSSSARGREDSDRPASDMRSRRHLAQSPDVPF